MPYHSGGPSRFEGPRADQRTLGGLTIEDLDSTNGTKVGGRLLTRSQLLKDGDQIKICGYQFEYVAGDRPPGFTPTIVGEIDATASDSTVSGIKLGEKFRAIMEVITELSGVLDSDIVLEKVLGVLFRIFPQAERGFLLFKDEESGKILTRAS